MQFDDRYPRLDDRGRASSRAKDVLLKALAAVAGAVALLSAFVISLAFFAVALAAILVVGGYLWWKTRDLRRQLRVQMQGQMPAQQARGDVIEGVVISRSQR